ncbi:putative Ubiquitin ligase protein cop1 [Heracleum sosnowskyi]|uniref:Ubiquitin ligase protein cop1 n=1 Tax=Heracleum sosnowskyi TaxID=360622 RepID=A0AAD8JMA7_9APIA|nr:putative Ubiquitin ligase protein cop1 [Heracleum sosnowskyi]
MEGSSDSCWQKSDSSRGLKRSGVSDRNPLSLGANSIRSLDDTTNAYEYILGRRRELGLPRSCEDGQAGDRERERNDISLRQWLDNRERAVTALDCLHIFRQIVEVVSLAHSQGLVVHNVRPSCFVMSSFNHVSFIESISCSDSGSDSFEDDSDNQTAESGGPCLPFSHHQKRQLGTGSSPNSMNQRNGSQMISGSSCLQSGSENLMHASANASYIYQTDEKTPHFPMKQILRMETNWYTSPEEVTGAPSSCASDIYRLGVLLFELYCTFSSAEEKCGTMSNLRHRVLPPQLLLKWPKEASFCLWLLHPQPTSRPKMGELLQSEFLNEPRDDLEERRVVTDLKEKIEEQDLSLEFLLLMQQRKQEATDKLCEMVSFISSDIDEVKKLQSVIEIKGQSSSKQNPSDSTLCASSIENDDFGCLNSRKRSRPGSHNYTAEVVDGANDDYQNSEAPTEKQDKMISRSTRLMRNFKKVESAYLLTRRRAGRPSGKPFTKVSSLSNAGRGSVVASERSHLNNLPVIEQHGESRRVDGWINSFLEGLCKYLTITKVKVKAELKQADLLNSSNLVCSLGFDRDGEFFATAGVNKKIKVFEYNTILDGGRDIHYPVVEMSSKSKLSSICWNGYIKSQIASSNFDGVVQVWDVVRNQVFTEMKEHEKRVWSVDYSVADPTLLASGSDDGSVKLWNINQGASAATIRTKANVCCVQFPSDSSNFLAFGSADHNIYNYDLRNLKMPLCTLVGHNKTVSYIKFIDSKNLVSASTDNTLKLWDLSTCTSRVVDCPLQSFTGHANVKNFVGLSISDGYIATGSETNEVFIYQKAFPMPALSFKFDNTDPLSGDELDDSAQFISSVCWRSQSSTLLAANSMGNIKLLEMV